MFDNNSTTIHSILDLYQQCRRNGDWARMYLETQDGREYFTISICPSAGKPANGPEQKKVKRKKPSQVRRDQFRRAAFLERKQCHKTESVSATNKIKDEEENKVEEKETMESVAGETRSSELSQDEKTSDEEKGNVEEGMTPEDLEKLEKMIRDVVTRSYEESLEKMKNELSFEKMKNEIDEEVKDDNDNDKEAKIWALNQKRSYINR